MYYRRRYYRSGRRHFGTRGAALRNNRQSSRRMPRRAQKYTYYRARRYNKQSAYARYTTKYNLQLQMFNTSRQSTFKIIAFKPADWPQWVEQSKMYQYYTVYGCTINIMPTNPNAVRITDPNKEYVNEYVVAPIKHPALIPVDVYNTATKTLTTPGARLVRWNEKFKSYYRAALPQNAYDYHSKAVTSDFLLYRKKIICERGTETHVAGIIAHDTKPVDTKLFYDYTELDVYCTWHLRFFNPIHPKLHNVPDDVGSSTTEQYVSGERFFAQMLGSPNYETNSDSMSQISILQ